MTSGLTLSHWERVAVSTLLLCSEFRVDVLAMTKVHRGRHSAQLLQFRMRQRPIRNGDCKQQVEQFNAIFESRGRRVFGNQPRAVETTNGFLSMTVINVSSASSSNVPRDWICRRISASSLKSISPSA